MSIALIAGAQIYTHTTSRTLPNCDTSLGSLMMPAPESGDSVELILACQTHNCAFYRSIKINIFFIITVLVSKIVVRKKTLISAAYLLNSHLDILIT